MSHIGAQPRLASEEEKHGSWKGGMMNRLSALARVYLVAVTALVGVATLGIGIWCLIDPTSFADVVQFHAHQHFLHDVGAFQLGLGVMLLLALIWGTHWPLPSPDSL